MHTTLTWHCDSGKTKADAHNSDMTLWQWQNKGRCTQLWHDIVTVAKQRQMHTTLTWHCDSGKTKADAHNSDMTLWQWQNKGRCTQSHTLWLGRTWQTILGFYHTTLLTTGAGEFIQGFASNSPNLKSIFPDQGIGSVSHKICLRVLILYFPFVNQICLGVVLS